MQLGMIGLGRMGNGMTERLREGGHDVQTYDPKVEARTAELARGAEVAARGAARLLDDGPGREDHRGRRSRSCSGSPTRATRSSTAATRTSATRKRRYDEAQQKGVHFVDAGVSGGIWGLEVGYCLMVGGDDEPVRAARADLRDARARGRLRARRPARRGALREDGPQRDRVRADAVVRGGVRDHGALRVRPRPARDLRHLALRLGRPLVAARAAALGVRAARRQARGHRAVRRGLGRGPLDDHRGDQRERAGAGDRRRRCSPASPRATRSSSRRRWRRRSATSSAATRFARSSRRRPARIRADGRRDDQQENPLARGAPAPAHAGALHARHLRRVRRPDEAQAASRRSTRSRSGGCCPRSSRSSASPAPRRPTRSSASG